MKLLTFLYSFSWVPMCIYIHIHVYMYCSCSSPYIVYKSCSFKLKNTFPDIFYRFLFQQLKSSKISRSGANKTKELKRFSTHTHTHIAIITPVCCIRLFCCSLNIISVFLLPTSACGRMPWTQIIGLFVF